MFRYLYRVLQDSLNTSIKHAQASTVTITMGQDAQAIALCLEDDGIGMLNTEPQPGRYGLASMQERVRRYDGELTIHSPIKKGRSEEHTSELQSRGHLVCRLLLEKKKRHRTPKNAPEHRGERRSRA